MTTPFLTNAFDSPYKGREIRDQITNPNIIAGRFSYYSGWYHGHGFDHCARYLMPDRDDVDRLIIGSFCSIGTGAAFIMAGNQGHRADWISTFPFFWWTGEAAFAGAENGYRPAGDTVVGSDVWIGAEAVIMPGITIGHGAVIATRAVVTRDVAPYTIVAGNPARPVRQRFEEDAVAMLLEMAWWDWPLDEIRQAMPLLCSGDVAGLYGLWRNARQA